MHLCVLCKNFNYNWTSLFSFFKASVRLHTGARLDFPLFIFQFGWKCAKKINYFKQFITSKLRILACTFKLAIWQVLGQKMDFCPSVNCKLLVLCLFVKVKSTRIRITKLPLLAGKEKVHRYIVDNIKPWKYDQQTSCLIRKVHKYSCISI